jgi:hypothetical protein
MSDSPTKKVTITLPGQNIKPPVYVAGSFTPQPWKPEEMDVIPTNLNADGQNINIQTTYTKIFDIAPGRYQYKFRLGEGEWWICDETKEIST